jgi:hypothetical protein
MQQAACTEAEFIRFNHLAGEAEQSRRHRDAERFGGVEIDHPPTWVALVPGCSRIGVTLHEELF